MGKRWWLRGLIYLILIPLFFLVLFPLLAKIECFLNPSSPCGIASLNLILLVCLVFLVMGLFSLTKGFINRKKK